MSNDNAIDVSLSDTEIAGIHDKLVRLETERDAAMAEVIKLRLAVVVALAIADKSTHPADRNACASLRKVVHNPAPLKKGVGIRLVSINGDLQ